MRKQNARRYSSDLTDAQWQLIEPLFRGQRFEKHHPRKILNAVFYLLKTGCQWRMVPREFAPWQTVYYHFREWMQSGLFHRLCQRLRRSARVEAGRKPSPSAAVIDAQSVKTTRRGGLLRGYDGGKKISGRKRHLVVDTLGLLLGVLVHGADQHESQKAPFVLQRLLGKAERLQVIFADKGYEGTPGSLMERCFGWILQIVRREKGGKGFEPLPKRWVIERTFSWFESYRRLSRDYEYHPQTSEAMIQLAMSRLMINRLA